MRIATIDIEIKMMIQGKGEPRDPNLEYCAGWHDFAGMGISVACAYDYTTGRHHVFMDDNLAELQALIDRSEVVVAYNLDAFDAPLLKANTLRLPAHKHYDLLAEIWEAAGLGREFTPAKNRGYSLARTAEMNIEGLGKTGHGSLAPMLWQTGQFGKLIDYCLNDVFITKKLMDSVFVNGGLWDPKTGNWLEVKSPARLWWSK